MTVPHNTPKKHSPKTHPPIAPRIYQINAMGVKQGGSTPAVSIPKVGWVELPPIVNMGSGPEISITYQTKSALFDVGQIPIENSRISIERRGGYTDNEHQTLIVKGPGVMTVDFLDIEEGYDQIRVCGQAYTGTYSFTSPTILTGMTLPPAPIHVPRGDCLVEWWSDGSVTGDGFSLTWEFSRAYEVGIVRFQREGGFR